MKNILKKLTKEEIKELSKAINQAQSKKFGNPLSLRKQEDLMADIFGLKNWSTVLGLTKNGENKASCEKCGHQEFEDFGPKMTPRYFCKKCGQGRDLPVEGSYQKTTIQYVVLSEGAYPEPMNLGQVDYDTRQGDCVGYFKEITSEWLTEKQAEEELYEAGSDPSFFNLNKLSVEVIEVLDDCYAQVQDLVDENNYTQDQIAQMIEKVYEEKREDAVKSLNRAIESSDVSEWEQKIISVESNIDLDVIKAYLNGQDEY